MQARENWKHWKQIEKGRCLQLAKYEKTEAEAEWSWCTYIIIFEQDSGSIAQKATRVEES